MRKPLILAHKRTFKRNLKYICLSTTEMPTQENIIRKQNDGILP